MATKTTVPKSAIPGASGRAAFSLCHRLRSKAMYMDVEYDPSVPGGIPGDGYFWCTHTQNCLGPDGRVADRDQCTAGSGRELFRIGVLTAGGESTPHYSLTRIAPKAPVGPRAGRFPHRVTAWIALRSTLSFFAGRGNPSPHPSPAALRAAQPVGKAPRQPRGGSSPHYSPDDSRRRRQLVRVRGASPTG